MQTIVLANHKSGLSYKDDPSLPVPSLLVGSRTVFSHCGKGRFRVTMLSLPWYDDLFSALSLYLLIVLTTSPISHPQLRPLRLAFYPSKLALAFIILELYIPYFPALEDELHGRIARQ